MQRRRFGIVGGRTLPCRPRYPRLLLFSWFSPRLTLGAAATRLDQSLATGSPGWSLSLTDNGNEAQELESRTVQATTKMVTAWFACCRSTGSAAAGIVLAFEARIIKRFVSFESQAFITSATVPDGNTIKIHGDRIQLFETGAPERLQTRVNNTGCQSFSAPDPRSTSLMRPS